MNHAAAPEVATPRLIARTMATFYLFGGLTGGLAAAGAEYGTARRLVITVLGVVAIATSVALSRWGGRWPRVVFHALVAAGTVLVAVGVTLGPDQGTALVISFLMVFVAVEAFFFFPLGPGMVQLGLAVGLLTSALLLRGDVPGWRALAVDAIVVAIATVTRSLAQWASGASRDPLTGLRNRRGFDEALQEQISEANRTGAPLSAALLDLDHFKSINDTAGHAAGDRALCRLAELWSRSLPERAVLGRHGGDEFSLLMPGLVGSAALDAVQVMIEQHPEISLSCGVAQYQRDESAAQLMRRADGALYDAKTAGRGRCELYGGPQAGLAQDLERALVKGEIQVHYQPVLDLSTGWVVGVEALARWNHPSLGTVPPSDFIPVAEQHGLIGILGEQLLTVAGRDLTGLTGPAGRQLFVGINVSGAELSDVSYPGRFLTSLEKTGLAARHLIVEVTESLLEAQSPTALEGLRALRAAGVRVAIDDFGTGYSSLSRLDTLPIDHIKLDHSFIATISTSARRAQMLHSMVAMCQTLGLGVIAEGIETQEHLDVLRSAGCSLGQGWLYSPALPLAGLVTLLDAEVAARSLSAGVGSG